MKKETRKNKSGQIFPVLLICIASLIVAVFVTKNVGESNINKTQASNSADSGSLTAASIWAGSFNRLIYRNWDKVSDERPFGSIGHWNYYMGTQDVYYYYKEMRHYYNDKRPDYGKLKDQANKYLDNAASLISLAITAAQEAVPLIEAGEPECAQIWSEQTDAAEKNLAVRELIIQAAYQIGAFNALTAYMGMGNYGDMQDGLASWFRRNQLIEHLCSAFTFMSDTHKRALSSGESYAINNSGYSGKLTTAQADAFNFWMGGGATGTSPLGGNSVSYAPPGGGCKITVDMVLPDIQQYEILMANWNFPKDHNLNAIPLTGVACDCGIDAIGLDATKFPDDPFNYASSYRLTEDLLYLVAAWVAQLADCSVNIYNKTIDAAYCCDCICDGDYKDCGGDCGCSGIPPICTKTEKYRCNFDAKYAEAETWRTCLLQNQAILIAYLQRVLSGGSPDSSIAVLRQWNNDIWDNLWPASPSKTKKILTCTEAKEYSDVAPDFPGMMVANIKDVFLTGEWWTSCDVSISCGGSSFSKSKFTGLPGGGKGELVGQFNDIYYPEIIEAN